VATLCVQAVCAMGAGTGESLFGLLLWFAFIANAGIAYGLFRLAGIPWKEEGLAVTLPMLFAMVISNCLLACLFVAIWNGVRRLFRRSEDHT
jgi:hypothetical protein